MSVWRERYNLLSRNAIIGANATETFGQDTSSRENINKYGSFNSAVITVLDTNGANILIDGQSTKKFSLTSPGTIKIIPEEGYFFNWIAVQDRSGLGMVADAVELKLAIAEPIKGGD